MHRLILGAILVGLASVTWPGGALAATRTINFDDVTAPGLFNDTEPLTDRYAGLGVTFAGPAAGEGGAILNESGGFGVSGHSAPNFLAFNNGTYAKGPETISFATPIHSATIKAGQGSGGTVTVTAFDGATPVSSSFRTSAPALAELNVSAARITSLRLEFTGSAVVWDDLVWGTAPVSANDGAAVQQNASVTIPAPGVLANDADADGDALTAVLTRAPGNGAVDLRPDGGFTYTPALGFSGSDSFDYRASDGTGNGNTATVTMTVVPLPPPPPPPPPPPSDIAATVRNSWLAFAKFTRVRRLSVRQAPSGARVRVTCKTKRKKLQNKRCPYRRKTFKVKSGRSTRNLAKPFRKRKRKLPVGTRITVTISAPGFIRKRVTFKVRKRKLPSVKTRCLPRGAKARRCT
jgi:hypothetical protein